MFEASLEPVSNRADWIETFEIVDDDTDEAITDLTGVSVFMQIRQGGYGPLIQASTDSGDIIFAGGGVVQWHIEKERMRSLCAGTYEIGVTIVRDGFTEQEIIGSLPVLEGIVR